MKKVAIGRAKGARNRSADSGKSAENARKMLFRGNEAKNTVKTHHLAFSGTQNELLFEFRNPRSSPTTGHINARGAGKEKNMQVIYGCGTVKRGYST
jgi:hypothetical protein